MNPLTNTKNQNLMNQRELRLGYTGTGSSWHRQYKDSAWIFVGGLHFDLTEGDIICVFSQYGEIVNINLVRDRKTGVSKGFAFLCYEDQRSTVLATDNLNGIKLVGRTIKVDHVEQYKVPKEGSNNADDGEQPKHTSNLDSVSTFVREHGCGPEMAYKLRKIQKDANKLFEEQRLKANHRREYRTEGGRSRRSRSYDRRRYAKHASISHSQRSNESTSRGHTSRNDSLHRRAIDRSSPSSPSALPTVDRRTHVETPYLSPPRALPSANKRKRVDPPPLSPLRRENFHGSTSRRVECSPELLSSCKSNRFSRRPSTPSPPRRIRLDPSISPPTTLNSLGYQIKQEPPDSVYKRSGH